ncbi:MAG: bifunctional phosphopantothenoylcysteine decarboxylase/phosphopantothenate--cysteine ligase CoaBC [Lawsonella sp.]
MRIVVGIGGGIAAYKACMVIREFTKAGHDVVAIPTDAARKFIGDATLEALTGNPVSATVFDGVPEVRHVHVGDQADLVVVVPTTANLLRRIANGAANDMLTTTLLMATCPVLLAPAMHTQMWKNPHVQHNVARLRENGITVMQPDVGRLTGPDSGAGRLPEPAEIAEMALSLVEEKATYPQDLAGRRIVVSGGGTQEAIDPVRYLGNRSSGLQGAALAACAAQRGADVTLVLGANSLPYKPAGVTVREVMSARDMQRVIEDELVGNTDAGDAQPSQNAQPADVLIMAAAVADFRPDAVADVKLKKGAASEPDRIDLTRNPDILAGVVASDHKLRVTVGFAAETGDADTSVLELGRAKLQRKGCDLLMVNEVGFDKTFGQPINGGWLLGRDGSEQQVPESSKRTVARHILDATVELLAEDSPR